MIDLEFSHENVPTTEEIAELLQESLTPIDGLLAFYEHLRIFENKYEMSSSEFVRRFANGEFGDEAELIQWVGLYHIAEVLKLRIQSALFYEKPPPLSRRL